MVLGAGIVCVCTLECVRILPTHICGLPPGQARTVQPWSPCAGPAICRCRHETRTAVIFAVPSMPDFGSAGTIRSAETIMPRSAHESRDLAESGSGLQLTK